MARTKEMKALEAIISRKREELGRLQTEIDALDSARRELAGEPMVRKQRAPRSNVKALVVSLLEEAGARGLNANMAVEMARARGEHLERGSVSSLLSRLKADNVVVYDNTVYRLSEYGERGGEGQPRIVLAHPTSKTMP